MEEKCSIPDGFTPHFSRKLNELIGLAFTAILSEGSDVDESKYQLAVFLLCRDSLNDPDKRASLITTVTHLLDSGMSAFKILGFPYYFDDFLCAYQNILNSNNFIPSEIKKEMQRILDRMF